MSLKQYDNFPRKSGDDVLDETWEFTKSQEMLCLMKDGSFLKLDLNFQRQGRVPNSREE